MLHDSRLRLGFGAVAVGAFAWGLALVEIGGFSLATLPFRFSSRDPSRALLAALVCGVAYALVSGVSRMRTDAQTLTAALEPKTALVAAALSLIVFVNGVTHGTFAATGADSYGYVSEAELWEKGNLHQPQPLASLLPWPDAMRTLGPLGYTPGPRGDDIVPIYSPGLPLLMAAFRKVLGSQGPYYVVPVFGALAVWLTFLLGRWLTGWSSIGLGAAFVLALSPPFLASLAWPMSDVPVTTAWTLAFLLALRGSVKTSAAAGVAASVAILIRPNLAPVAAVVAISLLWRSLREHGLSKRALLSPLAFVCGVVPGVAGVAALNANLYGSPLHSGYYSVHRIYTPAYLTVNLPRYARWIIIGGCSYVFVGIGAILFHWPRTIRVRERGAARFLVAGAIFVIWLSYLFWVPFQAHEWWFLRFLLPFWPLAIVCAAALVAEVLRRIRGFPAPAILIVIAMVVGPMAYLATRGSGLFEPRAGEAKYARAAAYVSARTPRRAMIFSMQHSGSIRYYADRVSVRWDLLDPAWLDRGVTALSNLGYRSYILLDDWEEPQFKERFGATNVLGRLDWDGKTVAPGVRLYDASSRLVATTPGTAKPSGASGTAATATPGFDEKAHRLLTIDSCFTPAAFTPAAQTVDSNPGSRCRRPQS